MDRRNRPTEAPMPLARQQARELATERLLAELFGSADGEGADIGARPAPSKEVSLHLDTEVLAAFQETGTDWQTRINKALAHWLAEHDPKELSRA
ncbi:MULTISPECIES: BrnA antitoxin family protein [Pseudomonas]|uniref:Uncharacterized conserved protein, DUF4415 family n=1 Tax=Pseudomonas kuykendallii TaxID=1007099 RepID=A0A1H3AFN2_9PSED|nr:MULTISPECIES: BrnA antitoxin family protein [Pseudomonas]MCQ4273450.1 BrnA antitoxin family protein [Pseudomonas kuykendallii]SDX28415.1 Uncharacterized conserved protein, DUF4415 family [Pseudomonas kuykendallii]